MNKLERIVLDEIGLDIDNTDVIDQDYGSPVVLNGRVLRYFTEEDDNENYFLTKSDTLFDVKNPIVMKLLFGFYLDKILSFEGRYFKSFDISINKNGSSQLNLRTDNEVISSDSYYEESLKFIDMILKLSGSNMTLHDFDCR